MWEKEQSLRGQNSIWKKVSVKVEVEELEDLLGPEDVDVDLRRILEEARDEKGCAIFETFSADGPSAFLVVSRSRWDKHQRRLNAPWRQNSFSSESGGQWQEGLERQRVGWSSVEKGLWRQWKTTWIIVASSTGALVSSVTVSALHSRTLPQGP